MNACPDISVFYVHEGNVVKSATELIRNTETKKFPLPTFTCFWEGRKSAEEFIKHD